MIICESLFKTPDPKKPCYSQSQVDIYASVPFNKHFLDAVKQSLLPPDYNLANHRLSLRKDVETGNYQLYRMFYATTAEQVIFSKPSLAEALKRAAAEWSLFYGEQMQPDEECNHRDRKSQSCTINLVKDLGLCPVCCSKLVPRISRGKDTGQLVCENDWTKWTKDGQRVLAKKKVRYGRRKI